MSWAALPLLLSLLLWPPQAAPLQCRPGREFWDSARQQCRNCSRCAPPTVVLRTCGVHRDALCGPISELNIDWSWINGRRREEPEQLEISLLEEVAAPAPRQPSHHQHHQRTSTSREHVQGNSNSPTSETSNALSTSVGGVRKKHFHHAAAKHTNKSTSAGRKRKRKHKKHSKTEHSSLSEDSRDKAAHGKQHAQRRKYKKRRHDRRNPVVNSGPEASFLEGADTGGVPDTTWRPEAASQVRAHPQPQVDPIKHADTTLREREEPFSATESLVWDGQAFALALAVFACLFFFVVAAVYSIYQARHWRRLKNNFEADVEELSAQLSLVASGCIVVEQQPATASPSTPSDGCGKRQCSYLEQLLACKQEREQVNVYIERQSSVREPTRPPSTRE